MITKQLLMLDLQNIYEAAQFELLCKLLMYSELLFVYYVRYREVYNIPGILVIY